MICVRIGNGIITIADETDNTTGLDMRTAFGNEELILRQIRQFGGFSVFWISENQKRACALNRLVERCIISTPRKSAYPWCDYIINGE